MKIPSTNVCLYSLSPFEDWLSLTHLSSSDLPDGNTKVTTFEVDTRIVNQPVVRVKVYVDAESADDAPAWEVQVVGKPLRKSVRETMAVGGLGMRLKELLSFLKRSWF